MTRLISALVLMLALALAGFAQQTKPIAVDDVLDIVGASNPEISPNGKWIIYSRSDLKWKDNKRESSLWMVSTDGTQHFRLTSHEGDSAAAWSADSNTIAFLSGRGGEAAGRQIWLIRTAGGEAWKLTEHKDGISAFEWSPDGKSIVFTAADPKGEEVKGEDAIAVDEGPNGQGKGRWSNIWTIDLAEKKEKQITKENGM